MKREEILEKSRKENKKKDLAEIEIDLKAGQVAAITMVILAGIFYVYEIISGKGINPALYALITAFNAALYDYKMVKSTTNRKLNIFTGCTWTLCTIVLLVLYFI